MLVQYKPGAIFVLFILSVHCVIGDNYNETRKIYIPSAPQNLTVDWVTSSEIHISWSPPTTFTLHLKTDQKAEVPKTVVGVKEGGVQADAPTNDVIDSEGPKDVQADAPQDSDDNPTFRDWYSNDKKFNDEYSTSDIMNDSNRSKRDIRYSHRHRKRRQEVISTRANETKEEPTNTYIQPETPKEIVKKSGPALPHKGATQIAYVLYYEQGLIRSDTPLVQGVPTSSNVMDVNVFPSDLGMVNYLKSTRNMTLRNTSGVSAKVVGFTLKNLTSFTPYKIWVRAFYNFVSSSARSSDLLERLGPKSDPLYVLTEVRPPSSPIVLNLTCDLATGKLYLQWRQPMLYDNSIDKYVVTLRKIPESKPRTRLTLPTNKNDIETTISMAAELWNITLYEVKIYAVTFSVTRPNALINGSESPPEELSSEWCALQPARPPDGRSSPPRVSSVALLAALPIAVLAALAVFALYCRCRSRLSKCITAAYSYLEEGGERAARAPLNSYKKPASVAPPPLPPPSAPRPPRMCGAAPPLRRRPFVAHVAALHADSDVGFSKEYEIVVTKSAALGHTSHYSHRPENRLKNRYLNITAYDHSRVCVSSGGRCGAAGCAGAGAAGACDYVNANFIDGMLPALDDTRIKYIKRKLDKRNRPQRQPSVKPTKPPPNLAEGIETAFLNIEFSGIVESEDRDDDSSSDSDDDPQLDDVYVDIEPLTIPTWKKSLTNQTTYSSKIRCQ